MSRNGRLRILAAGTFEADSDFAHAINTTKMAQGFAELGHEVVLVCRRPKSGRIDPARLAERFGANAPMVWRQLPGVAVEKKKFSHLAMLELARFRPHVIYARDFQFPIWTSRLRIPTIAETHSPPDNRMPLFLALIAATPRPGFRLLVTISEYLARHYRSLGADPEKILVLPDAVDLGLFSRPVSLPESPYPADRPNVTYCGHLYDYKGIPTVLEAAARIPDVRFHLVGGLPEDRARQEERARELGVENVVFHGLRPHSEVPPFLWHADVLLLPPSQHHPSASWTSPVKLGEYLASGTPVVATDIPALRDWLDDDVVDFVAPDDPGALADGIRRLLEDPARSRALARAGLQLAEKLSYQRRAQRVLERASLDDGRGPSPAPPVLEKPGA